jgi:DNA-binding MarR family transcriptional regulator
MMETATLEAPEDDAWRAFNAAHGRVIRELDHDLVATHHLSLAEYEVLMHLDEADDRRLRMNELAELCGLSPSGLTRRFDSMVRSGLVRREKCDDDRRGVFAVLTQSGHDRLAEAAPIYSQGVRRAFVAPLEPNELDTVTTACERIAPRRRYSRH